MSTEDKTHKLSLVPTANRVEVSYFRDDTNPERVLTVARRKGAGVVEVGYAICKPDSAVPYRGKLYQRVITQLPIDPAEKALLEAIDKKYGNRPLTAQELSEFKTPVDRPPPEFVAESTRFEHVPQFVPVFIEGMLLVKGDAFKRSEGRRLAVERLNDEDQVVRVIPRPGETILYTALRGLRDDERTKVLASGEADYLIPELAKRIADEVMGWVEMEFEEERQAKKERRSPFWTRMAEGASAALRGLVGL